MTKESKLEVVQAFDGQLIQTVELVTASGAEKMLAVADKLHRAKSEAIQTWERIDILGKLVSLMRADYDKMATLIAQEGGKPLTDARVEVERAIHGVELAIAELGTHHGTEIPMGLTKAGTGRLAFTTKEPIGVVMAVSAFNHPLNLIVHQVVPAVAVGCPVIVKPAGPTPLSCLHFVDLLHKAGLPSQWCQVCVCENKIAEKMITDPRVAFFSFIGSAKVGWYLRSKLAPGTRCALEHGGAAPVIITKDADIDNMLPLLIKGGYYHAGQVCVSVQRIFVDNIIKADFAEAFKTLVAELKVGDPSKEETQVGPLIRTGEVDRVENWVAEALDDGAQCLTGGKRLTDRIYAPTVILDPAKNSKVSRSEIFGPVTCIYGYDDVDAAIHQANDLPVAFQASVFSQNIDTAFSVARKLDAAAVMVNDHTAFRVDWMPFAGRKTSGLGVGGIGHTMSDMSQDKLLVLATK